MEQKVESLNDSYIGKSIRCKIGIIDIPNGKIQKEGNRFFICQNIAKGTPACNLLGFSYSWCIDSGNNYDLISNQITNLFIIDSEVVVSNYEIY